MADPRKPRGKSVPRGRSGTRPDANTSPHRYEGTSLRGESEAGSKQSPRGPGAKGPGAKGPGAKGPGANRPGTKSFGAKSYDPNPSGGRGPSGRPSGPKPYGVQNAGPRPSQAREESVTSQERPYRDDRPAKPGRAARGNASPRNLIERTANVKPERSSGPLGAARLPKDDDGWLYGRHSVIEAMANLNRVKRRLLLAIWDEELANMATAAGLVVEQWERRQFDKRFPGQVHQGIALDCDLLPDLALEDFLEGLGERSTLMVLDKLTDPHNVGAILRSAAAFGADGVITQRRNAPPPTALLAKTASGALEHIPYIQETNLARSLDRIQEANFITVGLDERGEATLASLPDVPRMAIVLGAEGPGLRRLVSAACDHLLRLPTKPPIEALNVSNAAAIALYERNRK